MKYAVKHRTWYAYAESAPVCHNMVHLTPRDAPRQVCRDPRLRIEPTPAFTARRTDYFGNVVDYFSIESAHSGLEVTATCTMDVEPLPPITGAVSPPWEAITQQSAASAADDFQLYYLTLASPRAPLLPEVRAYAASSFPAGRPILQAVQHLSGRIHADFAFDSKATTIHTSLDELLKLRRGVCQDFAHLTIGCLRAMGLPARYVSGYLLTAPPPGKPRLVGADASHAWISAYCGPLGWIDVDPTNNSLVSDGHICVAWGRDYGDVCPIQGVFVGGGEPSMGVSVDVAPLEESPVPARAAR